MTSASAVNLKRVTLELGGKSPLVIFNDADGKSKRFLPIGIFINYFTDNFILSTRFLALLVN